ncbi:hypothetical protein ACTXT7_004456 [Hymenolepis weldensis]
MIYLLEYPRTLTYRYALSLLTHASSLTISSSSTNKEREIRNCLISLLVSKSVNPHFKGIQAKAVKYANACTSRGSLFLKRKNQLELPVLNFQLF